MSWLNKKNIFSYLPLIRGNQNNISLMYVQLLTIKLHKFVEHFFFYQSKGTSLFIFSVRCNGNCFIKMEFPHSPYPIKKKGLRLSAYI